MFFFASVSKHQKISHPYIYSEEFLQHYNLCFLQVAVTHKNKKHTENSYNNLWSKC